MTEKTKLCGFQPTGNSEDIPKPPKFKPANTDKIQEHLLPYSKEMVQKIRDEKMQLVTADEFVKLHKESLTAIRENDKLQEQLNTIKAALIVIRADIEEHNQIYDLSVDTALLLEGIDGIAFDALAAIGGDDEL
ncbi:hypothetical protein [Lactococcus lactis]|uniref:hypothetical protein n=1 Tax=Lactococcus lactis TaxID=1358 RepID=UPI0028928AAA|nr:hypothetical protein [Lactococcus lactis]MDT2902721.1 hypothetical protein [Lactococcus lactis]